MRRFLIPTMLSLALLLLTGSASGDYDIRDTFSAAGAVHGLNTAFEYEARFNDDGNHYNHFDMALSRNVVKWLSLGGSFRQIYTSKEDEIWKQENTPSPIVVLSHKLSSFSIKDKSKFEIRFRAGKDTTWRYRNKLTLASPLKATRLKISPYLADEIFIDEDGFARNRISLGAKLTPIDSVQCELFGMIQSDNREDEWENTNVLGTKVKAKF